MKVSNAEKAEILVQALPYIQEYTGKIIVIKYGGNAMINDELKKDVMQDIVLLWQKRNNSCFKPGKLYK